MRESQVIGPVLKWVGGKRQLLREILPRVETIPYTRYVEPFFGGGGCCLFLPAAGQSCHQ